jgi:plasmid stability protein
MSSQITVRNVSAELARRLQQLAQSRGESVNTTVIQLLEAAVGMDARRARLERYVTWTQDERVEFEHALAAQRTIDDELWR